MNEQEILSRLAKLEGEVAALRAAAGRSFFAGSRKSFGGKTKDLSEPMTVLEAAFDAPAPGRLVVLATFTYNAGSKMDLFAGGSISALPMRADFNVGRGAGEKEETIARAQVKDGLVAVRPVTLLGHTFVKEPGPCLVRLTFQVSESSEPYDQFARVQSPQLCGWLTPEG